MRVKNIFFLDEDHACLKLTKDKWALVDVADLPLLQQYKWCTLASRSKNSVRFYAMTGTGGKFVLMHRLLLDVAEVDHKNGNTLDNRRENLRPASRSQNMMNKPSSMGIYYDKRRDNWQAYIEKDGRRELKRFATEEEAIAWRREKEQQLFGEFAPPREEQH